MNWEPLFLLLLLATPGCKKTRTISPDEPAGGTLSADEGTIKYEHCARFDAAAGARVKPITIGGVKLTVQGPVLRAAGGRQAARRLVLGVLGDTREATAANLTRLGLLGQHFKRRGAVAIVVLGGIDASYEGVRAVLAKLQGSLPVLALPGDRASRSGFSGAVDNLGSGVVDFTRVRAVQLPGASLVGLPGYFRAAHLMAGEQGCSYDAGDLARLARLASRLPRPRVLLSHGPPRGQGTAALDRAFGDINIGDPALPALVRRGGFGLVLCAHVHESGGRATTVDGRPVGPGVWASSLMLNVGAADSTPHEDLQGAWSRGSAALVELSGQQVRYRMIDLSRLTPAGGVKP